jgi:hypothetical protein
MSAAIGIIRPGNGVFTGIRILMASAWDWHAFEEVDHEDRLRQRMPSRAHGRDPWPLPGAAMPPSLAGPGVYLKPPKRS